MDLAQFENYAAAGYNRIPVFSPVDLTVSLHELMLLLSQPHRALLQFHDANQHMISIVGLRATQTILCQQQQIIIKEGEHLKKQFDIAAIPPLNPLEWLSDYHSSFKAPRIKELPDFAGGLFGYIGNSMCTYTDLKALQVTSDALPDFAFLLCDDFLIIDHDAQKTWLVCYIDPLHRDAYEKAQAQLVQLAQTINTQLQQAKPKDNFKMTIDCNEQPIENIASLLAHHDFNRLTIPINLAIRGVDGLTLFTEISKHCTLPGYFLHFDDFYLFGFGKNSLKKFHQTVQVKYIPEVFPTFSLSEDWIMFNKQQIEHDLKPICLKGSISLQDDKVYGELPPKYSAIDVIKAILPYPLQVGSKTPHALEVIHSLPTQPLHAQTGLIGMFNWHEDFIGQFNQITFCYHQEQLHMSAPLFCHEQMSKMTLLQQVMGLIKPLG